MQTAVRKRAADFDFWGNTPTPRNFAKIRMRGGRGLQPVQPKDSIPPWGHAGTRRARRGRFAPESSGRRRTGSGVPRRARRGKAGAATRYRGAAGGGASKTAAPSAACVGFQATSAIEAAGGRKSPFLPYKEALFPGAALVKSELFCARILVASVGLLFRRRGVMNVSRRAGRAKSPAGKQNAIQRKEHTP